MNNPIRRNRNIGTSKQGHGKNNTFRIPQPLSISKTFYERLGRYEKTSRTINGHRFEFVIEETRADSIHACTVDDVAEMIRHIPPTDYGELNLIVFRQPKRKELLLSPVWGRLIYGYEFEGEVRPAVILEAVDYHKPMKWSKSLQPDYQKELERLRNDGHEIVETKRHFKMTYSPENVRNTQLYRTLPHEFGHYVHYLNMVEKTSSEDEEYEIWKKRYDDYFRLSSDEKEKFAHNYADKLCETLRKSGNIPFERMGSNK